MLNSGIRQLRVTTNGMSEYFKYNDTMSYNKLLSFKNAMEYILFIYNNTNEPPKEEQWDKFFAAANESGMFNGGSEISSGLQIGAKSASSVSNNIVGYMRFETSDIEKLHQLLELHPVKIQGGTIELCATPKT